MKSVGLVALILMNAFLFLLRLKVTLMIDVLIVLLVKLLDIKTVKLEIMW